MSEIDSPEEDKINREEGEERDDLDDTEHNEDDDLDPSSRSISRKSQEMRLRQIDELDQSYFKRDELLKRRTGGILTGVNIHKEDKERSNINSLKKISGDGNIREANFASLTKLSKKPKMFKELLVSGKFKQIDEPPEETPTDEGIYELDDEDILEYKLFNSIDKWSRRVTGLLNIF